MLEIAARQIDRARAARAVDAVAHGAVGVVLALAEVDALGRALGCGKTGYGGERKGNEMRMEVGHGASGRCSKSFQSD